MATRVAVLLGMLLHPPAVAQQSMHPLQIGDVVGAVHFQLYGAPAMSPSGAEVAYTTCRPSRVTLDQANADRAKAATLDTHRGCQL